jgi:hypothetical protein
MKADQADLGRTLNVDLSPNNDNFPNSRVEVLGSTGGGVVMAYLRNIQRAPPLQLLPDQAPPPAVCRLVKLAHATSGCTLGVSSFQRMLDNRVGLSGLPFPRRRKDAWRSTKIIPRPAPLESKNKPGKVLTEDSLSVRCGLLPG